MMNIFNLFKDNARQIALFSWIPVVLGASLSIIGDPNLAFLAGPFWIVGIVMQFIAGFLHYINKNKKNITDNNSGENGGVEPANYPLRIRKREEGGR